MEQIWNEKPLEYRWVPQLFCVFLIHLQWVREPDKYRLTKQHLRAPKRKTRTMWAFAFAFPSYALHALLVEAVIERGGAKPLGNRNNR